MKDIEFIRQIGLGVSKYVCLKFKQFIFMKTIFYISKKPVKKQHQ